MFPKVFLLLSLSSWALAQAPLTEGEKATILAKIEALEDGVIEKNEDSQASAIEAFDAALKSEDKTYELFERCRKKVYFEEEKRDDKDARDSERMLDDALSDEFKRALLHQLYFLRHSLEARYHPTRRMKVAKQLVEGLGQIVKDEDQLNYEMVFNKEVPGYSVNSDKLRERIQTSRLQKQALGGAAYSPLYQDPFQSVFAKAYKIDHLRPDSWTRYPMDFNGLYKEVILKDLIEQKEFKTAREQWTIRIKGEAVLHKEHGIDPSGKGDTPASYDKYMDLTVPALQWSLEAELFSQGDEKAAATSLFALLESHQDHPKYLDWVKWFKKALK